MRIAQEEVFGPVLSVIPFRDEEEAVRIAKDVVYGLASGIWTQSIRRAITISERIQAGTVWVNTYRAVSYMRSEEHTSELQSLMRISYPVYCLKKKHKEH